MRGSPARIALAHLMLLGWLTTAAATPPTILRTEVRLGELGLDDPAAIRAGRLAVIRAPTGDRLEVQLLHVEDPVVPASPEPSPPVPSPSSSLGAPPQVALWVWETAELLAADARRADFLAFVGRQGFTEVYLQLPATTGEPARLAEDAGLRRLIAALGKLGVAVWALDGHPSFVLPERREAVLQTAREVAAWNATAEQGERFRGLHYDVEPYLLPGFAAGRRAELLTAYVELVASVAALAHAHGLELGIDVPFWYDAPDEHGHRLPEVTHAGRRRGVLEHLFDRVDVVVIMDYRTAVEGPNGILAHARGELALAARTGKRVYVGLETGELPDEVDYFFAEPPRAGLPPDVNGAFLVWVARGELGTVCLLEAGQSAEGCLAPGEVEGARVLHWPLHGRVEIPSERLSFARLGAAALEEAVCRVDGELRGTPGFGGFALHYYTSLRALLEPADPTLGR